MLWKLIQLWYRTVPDLWSHVYTSIYACMLSISGNNRVLWSYQSLCIIDIIDYTSSIVANRLIKGIRFLGFSNYHLDYILLSKNNDVLFYFKIIFDLKLELLRCKILSLIIALWTFTCNKTREFTIH